MVMGELSEKRTFFFDIERTLMKWNTTITGAEDLITRLKDSGRKIRFHTDNSLVSRKGYAKRLTANGIPTEEEEILNSAYVATEHLYRNNVKSVYTIGEAGLVEELDRRNIEISKNSKTIVLGLDRNLNYRKIEEAVKKREEDGLTLVLGNQKYFETSKGLKPGQKIINSIIETYMSPKNIGKPSEEFRDIFRNYFSYYPDNSVLIGDRREDILLGNRLGMTTVAVMSGEIDKKYMKQAEGLEEPDYGLSSLHRLTRKII